jgi:hypothetical protein
MTTPTTRCEPLLVNTASPDEQGYLLFVDNKLVAVLVRVERDDELDGTLWGRWCLEAAFGPCHHVGTSLTFAAPEEALEWAAACVEAHQRGQLPLLKAA